MEVTPVGTVQVKAPGVVKFNCRLVSDVAALFPATAAEMVTVPSASAVARPLELIELTAGSLEVQVDTPVRFCVEPSV